MSNSVLDELESRRTARRPADAPNWRELIRRVASNDAPDAASIEAIMLENGKKLDDLRAGVAEHNRRVPLAEAVGRIEALGVELATQYRVQSIVVKGEEEQLAALKQKFNAKLNEVQREIDRIEGEKNAAERSARQLVATCPYSDLVEQLRSIDAALNAETRGRDAVQIVAADARKVAEDTRETLALEARMDTFAPNYRPPDGLSSVASDHARALRTADKAESELQSRDSRLVDLRAKREQIEKEMLKP